MADRYSHIDYPMRLISQKAEVNAITVHLAKVPCNNYHVPSWTSGGKMISNMAAMNIMSFVLLKQMNSIL